jgi:YfiH family protein
MDRTGRILMQENKIGDLEILSYLRFEPHRGVTNIVTTRVGGRSAGVYSSLNLGLHVGDDPDTVLENRALISEALAIDPEAFTIAEQVHRTKVGVIKATHRGRGAVTADDALARTDAMITNVSGIPLTVLIADCVAVSIYDPDKNAIGLTHAGWKGTLGRIAEATVKRMEREYECDAANLLVGLSPAIGKGHYEVGEDLLEAFREEFGRERALEFIQEDMDGTCYLDLWGFNEWQLVECGVPRESIEISGLCTACHPERFYSHRHDGGNTGRFAALVMLHSGTSRQY